MTQNKSDGLKLQDSAKLESIAAYCPFIRPALRRNAIEYYETEAYMGGKVIATLQKAARRLKALNASLPREAQYLGCVVVGYTSLVVSPQNNQTARTAFSKIRPRLINEGYTLGYFPPAPLASKGALISPVDNVTRVVIRNRQPADTKFGELYRK